MLPWKAFSARSRQNVQIINLIPEPKLAPLSSSTSKLGTIGNVCTLPWTTLARSSSNENRVIHRVHKNGSGPARSFFQEPLSLLFLFAITTNLLSTVVIPFYLEIQISYSLCSASPYQEHPPKS